MLVLFLADTLNAIFNLVYVYDALVINFSAAIFQLIVSIILHLHADNVQYLGTANWSVFIILFF